MEVVTKDSGGVILIMPPRNFFMEIFGDGF